MNRGNAGRAEQIRCEDYLSRHGDYIDGLLSPIAVAQLRAHASLCSSCARYDRIVRKGLDLVQLLPEIEPSEDFEQRLQHRIFHLQDETSLAPARPGAGAAAALGVAATIALLAWSPMMLERQRELAAPRAEAPSFQPLAVDVPQAVAQSWYTTIPVTSRVGPQPARLAPASAVLPGPYSPLVVQPPMSVRTVSREATQD